MTTFRSRKSWTRFALWHWLWLTTAIGIASEAIRSHELAKRERYTLARHLESQGSYLYSDPPLCDIAAAYERSYQFKDFRSLLEAQLSPSFAIKAADLSFEGVDSEILSAVAHVGEISSLRMTGSTLSGADLRVLAGFKSLRRLYLDGTAIDDGCATALGVCRQLKVLSLANTRVTDEVLTAISSLPQLEALNLEGTAITSRGLMRLQHCSSLREVNLYRTQVTAASVAQLDQALPLATRHHPQVLGRLELCPDAQLEAPSNDISVLAKFRSRLRPAISFLMWPFGRS